MKKIVLVIVVLILSLPTLVSADGLAEQSETACPFIDNSSKSEKPIVVLDEDGNEVKTKEVTAK